MILQNLHSICFPTVYNICWYLQNSGKKIKEKKVGGGVPVPWMLWYLQYILIHLIKFIEILWHNLTVDLLRQDVNLFIYD